MNLPIVFMFKKFSQSIDWKLFRLLFTLGFLSFLAILPYLLSLQSAQLESLEISLPIALLLSSIQTGILLAIILFFGLLLAKKNNIGLHYFAQWSKKALNKTALKKDALLSMQLGLLAGLLIIGFDSLFSVFLPKFDDPVIALWKSLLGSFYGGIFEELLLRLFFLSLLIWVFNQGWKRTNSKAKPSIIWFSILLASIAFGLGHLPATALLTEITPLVVARAIILNSIGGIIFGWLFWKKGLLPAMVAHYTTDIMLLIVFPTLLSLIA